MEKAAFKDVYMSQTHLSNICILNSISELVQSGKSYLKKHNDKQHKFAYYCIES